MLSTKQTILNLMYELIEKIENGELEVYDGCFTVNPQIIERDWLEHSPLRQYTGRVDYTIEIKTERKY